ncbi:tetratricopeptide repeat protein [Bacillus sp. WMMC1349]|uniref:tetratricopeptide repeat protein n=1 Tax=Bacillus sp. WMMC1349 TaxID=2736254 RepID=UPI0015562158|nr:tetratricopeptide repeat protein [Bacillus sp. WMMC1349]NPC94395.1 tetratricopeptide repeat protein [Bacillus sp. WMMC1349]
MEDQMDIMYEKALQLSNWGRTDDAVKAAEQFLAYYPDSYEGYFLLSRIYYDADEYKKVIQFAKKAVTYDPINEDALTLLMYAYYATDMFDQYLETNKILISQYPESYYPYYLYGYYLLKNKQEYEKARFYIEKALEMEPNDSSSLAIYSEILAFSYEDHLSKEYSDRALAQNIEDSQIFGITARAAFYRGDFSQALDLNKAAIKLDPNNQRLVNNLMFFMGINIWFMKYPLKIKRFHEKLRFKHRKLFWSLLIVATFILKILIFPYLILIYGTPHVLQYIAGPLVKRKMPEQMEPNSGCILAGCYLLILLVISILFIRWIF